MNKKNIHWYPGHMKKAFDELETRLKVIDVVIEICDSRAPISSRNPFLDVILKDKKRIIVLSKKDLSDIDLLTPFIHKYEEEGFVLPFDVHNKNDIKELKRLIEKSSLEKRLKEQKKGMKPQPIRVMVIGIPNVGKSSLINALVGKQSASKANKPGHTRAQQWIRSLKDIELLDTPGILPPHYEDPLIAKNLALIGAIPSDILPTSSLYDSLKEFLLPKYQKEVKERFHLKDEDFLSSTSLLQGIARERGLLLKEGKYDFDAVERLVLKEFKEGKIVNTVIDSLC